MNYRNLLLALCATLAAHTASAQEPILIGEVSSMSGALALGGVPGRQGAIMALEEINAKGGVLGRPLQFVARDDKTQPEEAGQALPRARRAERVPRHGHERQRHLGGDELACARDEDSVLHHDGLFALPHRGGGPSLFLPPDHQRPGLRPHRGRGAREAAAGEVLHHRHRLRLRPRHHQRADDRAQEGEEGRRSRAGLRVLGPARHDGLHAQHHRDAREEAPRR